jgi:hypothetical protein
MTDTENILLSPEQPTSTQEKHVIFRFQATCGWLMMPSCVEKDSEAAYQLQLEVLDDRLVTPATDTEGP